MKHCVCWPCFYRLGQRSPLLRVHDEDEMTELAGALVCVACRAFYEPKLAAL